MVKENEQNDRLPSGKSEGNDRKVKRNLLKKSWIKKKQKKNLLLLMFEMVFKSAPGVVFGFVRAGWVGGCLCKFKALALPPAVN